jgi:hypothetical protein
MVTESFDSAEVRMATLSVTNIFAVHAVVLFREDQQGKGDQG